MMIDIAIAGRAFIPTVTLLDKRAASICYLMVNCFYIYTLCTLEESKPHATLETQIPKFSNCNLRHVSNYRDDSGSRKQV